MSARTLHTLGTPHGAWAHVARALTTQAEQAQDGRPAVDGVVATHLALVERPAVGLAIELAAGRVADPAQWLDDWCEGARRLLRQVQSDRTALLLLDAGEARTCTDALGALLGARFGIELPVQLQPVDHPPLDALSSTLAEAMAYLHTDARALHAELLACCETLAPDSAGAWVDDDAPRIDAAGAVATLQFLRDSVAHAQAELHATRAAVQAQEQRTLEAQRAADELQARLDDALLTLMAARAAQAETTIALAAANVRAEALDREQQLVREEVSQRAAEAHAARAAAQSAERENELLVLQLHQVQEELEHYYLTCKTLERSATNAARKTRGLDVTIDEIIAVGERDTPPHRELTFMLSKPTIDGRAIGDSQMRLVEHHGHPGLVLFGNADGAHLLNSWHETGMEGGLRFELLVPSDASCAPLFDAMATSDWLLTQHIAARIEARLGASDIDVAPHWLQLARRLHEQLLEMPPRVRYSSMQVDANAADGTLVFHFANMHYGTRTLPRLTVHWQPEAATRALVLLCDDEFGPPLLSWPDDEHGQPKPDVGVPLLPDARAGEIFRHWERLPEGDRAFIRALLAAWPGIVAELPIAQYGNDARRQLLLDAAARLPPAFEEATDEPAPPGNIVAPQTSASVLRKAARRLRRIAASPIAGRQTDVGTRQP